MSLVVMECVTVKVGVRDVVRASLLVFDSEQDSLEAFTDNVADIELVMELLSKNVSVSEGVTMKALVNEG